MSFCSKSYMLVTLSLLLTAMASCHYGPPAVQHPGINASKAGRLAMEMYDTNGDGVVSGDELENAASLKSALARLDTNNDKSVSADEIAERINKWHHGGVALMTCPFTVTLDGQPVAGATVTFEPEEFLGDRFITSKAVTDEHGSGSAVIPKEQRPDPTLTGMHIGLYKVKISKQVGGRETIPARYNEHTVLGQEVNRDVPEIANNRVVYALKSK